MGKTWVKPMTLVQKFEANEAVAAQQCYGINCNIDVANAIEKERFKGNGVSWRIAEHSADGCGAYDSHLIIDTDGNGVPDLMRESSGKGEFDCTIYTDDSYTTSIDISQVSLEPGTTIYWTTEDWLVGNLIGHNTVWHHQGTIYSTVEGHPNRS